MRVIYGIGKIKNAFKGAVLVIGVFDGLHIGHQKLIKAAVKRARRLKRPTVVMTFSPHPVHVLKPEKSLPFVVSLPHRLKLIEQMGVDACIVVRFTKAFARQTADQFIKRYLVGHIRAQEIFVGGDFRFGQNRHGTLDYFKEVGAKHGFKVKSVVPVEAGRKKIGSSRIRQLIMAGQLTMAEKYLGRKVSLMGKVVKGDARGKSLGFPTANIHPQNQVIPPVGVYAVRVIVGNKKFKGMANVGVRPSFKQDNKINVEANIFNFKKNIYGTDVIIEFVKKIRPEKKFASAALMSAQLARDEKKARSLLK